MNTRLMRTIDYDDLVALWSRFPGNTMTAADSREGFSDFIGANGEFCIIAEDCGDLVGSVMAGHDTRRGYIYHLAVSEELQGKGAGRLLMGKVEEALKRAGIEKIHLFIHTDNPAVTFYERIGWKVRRDILVMSRVLIGAPGTGTRENQAGIGTSCTKPLTGPRPIGNSRISLTRDHSRPSLPEGEVIE